MTKEMDELFDEYDFAIEYPPSKENVVVDALSRKSTLAASSTWQNSLIDEVHHAMPLDSYF